MTAETWATTYWYLPHFLEYYATLVHFANIQEIAKGIRDPIQLHIQIPENELGEQLDSDSDQGTIDVGEIM